MTFQWLRRRVVLVVIGIAAALVALGGVAWAYWTAQAANVPAYSVADSMGVGARPTASIAGGTATVSWAAATTSSGHAVGGYLVNRYATATGGTAIAAAQGTCAGTVTGTSCSETNLPAGTWYYTVTPVLGNWRGAESPRANPISTSDTFVLSLPGGTTTLTAGSATTLTITATVGGQTDTGYAGAQTLTFTGPGASPNNTVPSYNNGSSSVTFTAGVATMPMTLYRAENPTLTVSATNATGSIGLTVNPATANSFAVPTPSSPIAGVAQQVSVTARDTYGNTATGYAGAKTLTWTGPANAPGGSAPTYPTNPVTFTNGVAANQSVTFTDAQTTTLTVSAGSISGTTSPFTVSAAALAKFALTQPATQTSGVAFQVTITGQDSFGNTVNPGSTNLTFSGPGTAPDLSTPTYPTNPVTFTNGSATVSITLVKAEAPVLRVVSGTVSGQTSAFTVNPGTAVKLAWTSAAVSSPGTLGSCLFTCSAGNMNNNTFTASVSVTDAHGNIVNNIGAGKTVIVTATGTPPLGAFTAPSTGPAVTLSISATGAATSTTSLTFQAPHGSWTTNTLTATGTYTSATATISK